MELDLKKQNLCYMENKISEKAEQAIDTEFSLPDYCPDIERILKCSIKPGITNAGVAGRSVTADGMAVICLLYTGKNGNLFGYEMSVPFSKNIDMPQECDNVCVQADCKTDYVNCRAVNERKVDVHGAVTIFVTCEKNTEIDVIEGAQGDTVQLRKNKIQVLEMAGYADKTLTVTEELEVPPANGAVSNIIHYHCSVSTESCKFVTGKAIIKGNVSIHVLYLNTEQNIEKLELTFPLNQIADIPGVDETSLASVKIDICSCDLKPHTNSDGEIMRIVAEMKVQVHVVGYNERCYEIATDAYSIQNKLDIASFTGNLDKKLCEADETFTAKDTLSTNAGGIEEVIDLFCKVHSCNVVNSEGQVLIKGYITAEMILKCGGECTFMEKNIPFEHKLSCVPGGEVINRGNLCILSCSYTIASDTAVEVRCELKFAGVLCERMHITAITDLTALENAAKPQDVPALVVYYAAAGEDVWDIAMRYNTSVDLIMQQNKLTNEILPQNKMLLIPGL